MNIVKIFRAVSWMGVMFIAPNSSADTAAGLSIAEYQDLYEAIELMRSESVFSEAAKGDQKELLRKIISEMCKGRLRRYLHLVPEKLPEEKEELEAELQKILIKVASYPHVNSDGLTLFESFINEGVLSIDPYFEYVGSQSYSKSADKYHGPLGTLGIEMTFRKGEFSLNPFRGMNAEKAGIRLGDRLCSVDETDVEGRTFSNVGAMLRGRPGSQVELGVVGESGKRREVTIRRGTETIPLFQIRPSDSIIETQELSADFLTELENEAHNFHSETVTLDFRGLAGGDVEQMAEFCELFLPKGDFILHEKGSYRILMADPSDKGREVTIAQAGEKLLISESTPIFKFKKIKILQGGFTASAAEAIIVSFKASDSFETETIGSKSFGKAMISRRAVLTSGAFLSFSAKKMLKPDGSTWEGEGLEPDILSP